MNKRVSGLGLWAIATCAAGCSNTDVCDAQQNVVGELDAPLERKADILIVVDNSGSMAEEQAQLVANFLNPNPDECPLADLANIDPQWKNPARDLYTGDGPLAKCGFVQLMAAFDNDFHIGVITTSVTLCDNFIPDLQGGQDWGFRPQRDCLQPNGPPGTSAKVISRADVTSDDASARDLAGRFRATLANMATFGLPYERGLDAMNLFLNGVDDRGDGACEGDFDAFRRNDAALVVVFLSDEEDCSHGLGDSAFADELENDTCGSYEELITAHSPGTCYQRNADDTLGPSSTLSSVAPYAEALRAIDPHARIAVIAGGTGAPGNIEPTGCVIDSQGIPAGGCFDSGGLSNFATGGDPCGPDTAAERDGLACCTADPGSRYYELAKNVDNRATDSICNGAFTPTLLDIASLSSSADFLELSEAVNPEDVVVERQRLDGTLIEIPYLATILGCSVKTGYAVENGNRVILCGDGRPQGGDTIRVRTRADAEAQCGQ